MMMIIVLVMIKMPSQQIDISFARDKINFEHPTKVNKKQMTDTHNQKDMGY